MRKRLVKKKNGGIFFFQSRRKDKYSNYRRLKYYTRDVTVINDKQ